jgi:hypothetical protein
MCDCVLAPAGDACDNTIVFNPSYSLISYSSTWDNNAVGYWHGQGRLNSPQAWSAGANSQGQWFQIDAAEVLSIAGVVTQGRRESAQWVTSFKVKVSKDGRSWFWVECGRTFDGNNDYNTKIMNLFDVPVKARYLRFYPISW